MPRKKRKKKVDRQEKPIKWGDILIGSPLKVVCFDLLFTATFEGYAGLAKYTVKNAGCAILVYGIRSLTNEFIPVLSTPVGFVFGGIKGYMGQEPNASEFSWLYTSFNNCFYEASSALSSSEIFGKGEKVSAKLKKIDDWIMPIIIECGEHAIKMYLKNPKFAAEELANKLLMETLQIAGCITLASSAYVYLRSDPVACFSALVGGCTVVLRDSVLAEFSTKGLVAFNASVVLIGLTAQYMSGKNNVAEKWQER